MPTVDDVVEFTIERHQFDTVTISGRRFSRAWAAAIAAASDDVERPALYHRVLVEVFDDGLQLVATDSYWLAKAWCPFEPDTAAPTVDELPSSAFIVADPDLRVRDLMRYVAKQTKKDDADHPDIEVTISPGDGYDLDRPTLDPTLAEPLVVVSIPGEQITVHESEIGYPTWRKLMTGVPAPYEHVTVSPSLLSKIGAAVNAAGCLTITFEFEEIAIRWRADDIGLDLCGLLMPMRRVAEDGAL